jgi:hypothetical protein
MLKRYWVILILVLIVIQAFPTAPRAGQAAPESTASLVAVVRQRIETDRLEVRVYQGKKLVRLAPFMELYVVTPVPRQPGKIENLANRSVAVVRSEKKPDRWEIYEDVWAGTGGRGDSRNLTLADNVFKVKQVFISSAQSPIELRLDEQVVRLKLGDAILVL